MGESALRAIPAVTFLMSSKFSKNSPKTIPLHRIASTQKTLFIRRIKGVLARLFMIISHRLPSFPQSGSYLASGEPFSRNRYIIPVPVFADQ
jgi:hypothetical protein